MNNKIYSLIAIAITGWHLPVQALPYLQLDVLNGTYNSAKTGLFSEDSLPTSKSFTLRGLIDPSKGTPSDDSFRISIAILNTAFDVTSTAFDFGTFDFGGITYSNSTSGIQWGTPPSENTANNGDIAPHGIFDTTYFETSVNLIVNQTVSAYNVDGSTLDQVDVGKSLYYIDSLVNTTNLNANYYLHFDFYTVGSNFKVVDFAPYSHDASSCVSGSASCGPGTGTTPTIPEPTQLALLGVGFLGMALARRNSRKDSVKNNFPE